MIGACFEVKVKIKTKNFSKSKKFNVKFSNNDTFDIIMANPLEKFQNF